MEGDFLGKAANEKHLARIAIKEKRFDDAWRHLNDQKIYYLQHASKAGLTGLQTLVLDSSPHEDMANILRMEGRHLEALQHLSYTYATNVKAKRPLITLERKLSAYHKRAQVKPVLKAFLSKLKKIESCDFVSVKELVV